MVGDRFEERVFIVMVRKGDRREHGYQYQNFAILIIVISMFLPSLKEMHSKCCWKSGDDELLREIVEGHDKLVWNRIADIYNSSQPELPKSPKQLRERYNNHSRFGSDDSATSKWSDQEVSDLMRLYQAYGAKWTEISRLYKGKSQNSLKNKFYGNIRKFVRRINTYASKEKKTFARPIKYESLVRVLEVQDSHISLPSQLLDMSQILRSQIVEYCLKENQEQSWEEVSAFVQDLRKFNSQTRCYKIKRDYKKSINSKKREGNFLLDQGSQSSQNEDQGNGKPRKQIPVDSIMQSEDILPEEPLSPKKKETEASEETLVLREYEVFQIEPAQILREAEILDFQVCQILGIRYEQKAFLFDEL